MNIPGLERRHPRQCIAMGLAVDSLYCAGEQRWSRQVTQIVEHSEQPPRARRKRAHGTAVEQP